MLIKPTAITTSYGDVVAVTVNRDDFTLLANEQ